MSIDSFIIELCIKMFDRAKYRKAKGAAKLHLVLDHDGYLPVLADLTDGKEADVNIANKLQLAPGTIVVMDRGYIDCSLFARWTEQDVFFVMRTKKNTDYYWFPSKKSVRSEAMSGSINSLRSMRLTVPVTGNARASCGLFEYGSKKNRKNWSLLPII